MRPGPDGGGAAAGRRACRCSVLREMACSSRTMSCCAFEMAPSSLALVASKVSITSDISLSFWKSSWYLLQGRGGRANGRPWRRSGSQWRWRVAGVAVEAADETEAAVQPGAGGGVGGALLLLGVVGLDQVRLEARELAAA